jgi:ubiquitin carboxyl-terminal hydrolase 5/13
MDPTTSFKFKIEERYQCHASGKVQYQYRDDYCLPIMIPMEAAVNKDELEAFAAKQAQSSANGNKA